MIQCLGKDRNARPCPFSNGDLAKFLAHIERVHGGIKSPAPMPLKVGVSARRF